MPFLSLNNANIQFDIEELTWRSYTVAKAIFTTSQIQLINKKIFAKVALDKNSETFVVHMTVLKGKTSIYLTRAV